MPSLPKRNLKQRLSAIIIIHIPDQPQPLLLLMTLWIRIIDNRPGLERELVGAVIRALEEDELVLMRVIERAGSVGADAEVERLDTGRGGIGAGVGGGHKFGTSEADLHVVWRGGEDGGVVDSYLHCFVAVCIELWGEALVFVSCLRLLYASGDGVEMRITHQRSRPNIGKFQDLTPFQT